ncbi:MAG: PVC-type heme-binding CxxCH protein [Planctomycetaceae bacterium]
MSRIAQNFVWLLVALAAGFAVKARAQEEMVPQILKDSAPQVLIFQENVQEHLKLSSEQKRKLDRGLRAANEEHMHFFRRLMDLKDEDRPKEFGPYQSQARQKMVALVRETLKEQQLKRLEQLVLQREGLLPAQGQPDAEIFAELKINEEQRKQIMEVLQAMQKAIEKERNQAKFTGNPSEAGPKVVRIRKEYEIELHAILSDVQRKQLQQMLGEPFNLDDTPTNSVPQTKVVEKEGKGSESRFRVQPGFEIEQVAGPNLAGSIVNMTFNAQGQLVVARENGLVFTLEDEDGDGRMDRAKEFTREVKNCQGLLAYDATTFYLMGRGPEGTGLYRLRDTDGDDAPDYVRLIHRFKGEMSEHGPHAVIVGPDGFLYICSGNMAWVTAHPEANSPVEKMYEGDLLPRYEDPIGHAAGIKVPAGTIWRLDPEGERFTLEAAGFRNHFDIAFNSLGEMFTFDSDMEYQEALPWYHPVRVMHSVPGADFGWRSNSGKWPPYYVDSLPALVDIGRGSPCGVTFYNHRHFPARYHDAFFMADWSYGRIFALHLQRHGATFKTEVEEFVTGKPLNVSDMEVGPDGCLYFCTGGRGTEGGVYRVRFTEATNQAPPRSDVTGAEAVVAALDQLQPQSAWGREALRGYQRQASNHWQPSLEAAAADAKAPAARRIRALSYLMQFGPEPALELARRLAKDDDLEIRAQAAVVLARFPGTDVGADLIALLADPSPVVQRRAAEGLIRTETIAPLSGLRPILAGHDRFARFAARLALERTDPRQWQEAVLADPDPRVVAMGLVALNKLGLVADDAAIAEAALARSLGLMRTDLPGEDALDALRCVELTLMNTPREKWPTSVEAVAQEALKRFPCGDRPLDYERARILAALHFPNAIDPLLATLEKCSTDDLADRADAIHYARCLVALTEGWTTPQRLRFLSWFDVSKKWKGKGGPSYPGYIAFFLRDTLAQLTEADRLALVREADRFPRAAQRVIERIDNKSDGTFIPALGALLNAGEASAVPRPDLIAALGRMRRPEATAILLHLHGDFPDDRDDVIRALANEPSPSHWALFVGALDTENKEAARAALEALSHIEQKPDGPAPYRAALQAARRLGQQGAPDALALVRQWAGEDFVQKQEDWERELDEWQAWYAAAYPGGPAIVVAVDRRPSTEWTFDQLLTYLEGEGRQGSVTSGRTIYEKANCSKCHRFEQIGGGLGPDLTTLSSRFKRKDILEATLFPSRVVADQYKSWLITTANGKVIHGMKSPDEGDQIVLQLSDASTLKLAKSEVEEIVESKQSIMPEGLLKVLRLEEIADLVAFLESGKAAPSGADAPKQ